MIIACIDGGLLCVPALIIYAILSATGGLVFFKRFKWCKKACDCKCHPAPKTFTLPKFTVPKRKTRVFFDA